MQFPIIGVDFLRHYGLQVDPASNRLVDRLTLQAVSSSHPVPGDFLQTTYSLIHRPLLTGLPAGPPASILFTGLSTGFSTATCGTQVQASGVPHAIVPSGSRGTPSEAATYGTQVSGLLGSFPAVVNAGKALPVPVHDVQHHSKIEAMEREGTV
jgi:hypothetical protein